MRIASDPKPLSDEIRPFSIAETWMANASRQQGLLVAL